MRYVYFTFLIIIGMYLNCNAADWRYLGGAKFPNSENVIMYFDLEGVEKQSDESVRVWTKAITENEIGQVAKKYEKDIVDTIVVNLSTLYLTPYMEVIDKKNNSLDYMDIIFYEIVARYPEIKPRMKAFYELDCRKKMFRSLSASIFTEDGIPKSGKKTEWDYISPESNTQTLYKIFCNANSSE